MGIDIVDKYRMWSLEDYQWLSSISNIISIITKMARTNEALDHSEKLLSEYLYQHTGRNRVV